MRDYFFELAQRLCGEIGASEVLLLDFRGEDSDFVRLNRRRIRQAGNVVQRRLALDLIEGERHATAYSDLLGNREQDLAQLRSLLERLREQRRHAPEDPYLNYATAVHNSEHVHEEALPDSAAVLAEILQAAQDLDLVGLWARGAVSTGFANSFGQFNWHASTTFNLDCSAHLDKDRAIKTAYAGFRWEPEQLQATFARMHERLALMQRPPHRVAPGRYRAYIAPAALKELLDMVSWGSFSLKSHRTAQTPLIKMIAEGRRLHPAVSLDEHHGRGLEPLFAPGGFMKPDRVPLIARGEYRECLACPRSAREYGVDVNSGLESPLSLEMAAGDVPQGSVLQRLGTGLYIGNLWYTNFSDRNDCRITGMTRFACFWVENGELQAPLQAMRFDDSIYHLLGDRFLGATVERELMLDSDTYEQRSTASHLLPGILVDGLELTL